MITELREEFLTTIIDISDKLHWEREDHDYTCNLQNEIYLRISQSREGTFLLVTFPGDSLGKAFDIKEWPDVDVLLNKVHNQHVKNNDDEFFRLANNKLNKVLASLV